MAKRPTPKKKQAKSQSSRRYKAFQNRARKRLINSVQLSTCPKCKEAKLQHTVCPTCGEYKGRKVINMEKQVEKFYQSSELPPLENLPRGTGVNSRTGPP